MEEPQLRPTLGDSLSEENTFSRTRWAGLERSRRGDANSPLRQSCGARSVGRWWRFYPGEERAGPADGGSGGGGGTGDVELEYGCLLHGGYLEVTALPCESLPPTTQQQKISLPRYKRVVSCGWEREESGKHAAGGADARTGCEETQEGVREGRGRFMWSILGGFLIQTYKIKRRPFVLNEGNQTFISCWCWGCHCLLLPFIGIWGSVCFYGSHMLSAWLSAPAGVHR